MPMAFAPRNPRIRERQVFYGAGNAGKSTAALTIARRFTTGTVHVADADDAWEFMLFDDEEANAKLIERDNYEIHHVRNGEWDTEQGHLTVVREIADTVEPGDLFVYDKINGGWGAVQDYYDHKVFGMGHEDYYLQMRKLLEEKRGEQQSKGEKGDRTAPLYDQLRDWGPINAQYRLLYEALFRISEKAHVIVITDAAICRDTDDGDMRRACQVANNNKPAGQKALYGWPHTVIYFTHDVRNKRHEITQVKDRSGRMTEPLYEEEWSDFTKTYLGPVARWKMQKVD